MAKVSVIVPVYGVEKYIERCARSLFEQTLNDIEYIFIDDCTPDMSIVILKKIVEEYHIQLEKEKKNVKILRMPTNSGLTAVRRHGMQSCTGDYFINCDSDDYVDTDLYEKMWKKAVKEDADIVKCELKIVENGMIRCDNYESDFFKDKHKFISFLLGSDKGLSSLCDKMIKRNLLTEHSIMYPKCAMNEDRILSVQFSYYAKKIVPVYGSAYYYLINSDSIVGKKSLEASIERVRQCNTNLQIVEKFLNEVGVREEYDDAIVSMKYFIRYHLLPYTNQWTIYKYWMTLYRDINWKVFFNPLIPVKEKIKCLLTMMGLYVYLRPLFH